MKQKSQKVWLDWYQEIKHERSLAWAILTIGVLGVIFDFFLLGELNPPYLILTAIGLYLKVRSSGLIEEGETTQLLRSEHHKQELELTQLQRVFSSQRLLILMVPGLGLVTYLSFVLGIYRLDLLYLLVFAVMFVIFVHSIHHRRVGGLLSLVILALLVLVTSVQILQPAELFLLERKLVFVGMTIFALSGLVLVSFTRQSFANRPLIKAIVFGLSLVYLSAWVLFNSLDLELRWQAGLLSLAVLMAGAGFLAWLWNGRRSFAKLLTGASLLMLLLFFYLFMTDLSIVLLWLGIAVFLFGFGVLTPSWSLRTFGLLALGVGTMSFWLLETEIVASQIWSNPFFWTGISIMLLALLTDRIYHLVRMSNLEERLQLVLDRFLVAIFVLTALVLILTLASGFWMVFGAVGAAFMIGQLAIWRRDQSFWLFSAISMLYAWNGYYGLGNAFNESLRLLLFAWLAILVLLTFITLRHHEHYH